MSNIDIRMILPELKRAAEGAFIKNIYQYGDVFVLKLYQPGSESTQLLIQPGIRVHLTEFRRVAPKTPTKSIVVLRKYLREKRISSVRQHDLDRIVVIEVGDEESSYKIVAELFGQGNLLLLTPDDLIFQALHYRRMKDRDIVPKAKYDFPPPRGTDIFGLDADATDGVIAGSTASVVRTLASRLNLDSLSCEEICALAGVTPTSSMAELDSKAMTDLRMGIRRFSERLNGGVNRPRIIYDDEAEPEEEEAGPAPMAFLPFEFDFFSDKPNREYGSFSATIDEFFGISESEQTEDETQTAASAEQLRLQKIIDKQSEGISGLLSEAERGRKEGELIYSHFQTVGDVLETLSKARSGGLSWDEIIGRVENGKRQGHDIAARIERIVPSMAQVSVLLDGTEVRLDIRLTAQENASRAYEMAKKSQSRAEGATRQIEKTRAKMDELAAIASAPSAPKTPVKARKKRWYEKYRWFTSSEGYLVLGGRDARSNEQLAKHQLESNDLFLHALVHGAPYTVIKVPEEPPGEQTIKEAGQFAVSFSRAWQDGLSNGDAYWVTPEQVSFTPPTGEYLPSGAIMIRGTKNYVKNLPVEVSVGVIIEDSEVIPFSGPPSAVEANTQYSVRILPGTVKKSQLVREVIGRLRKQVPEESAETVDQIPQEDWMRVLPPGDGRVL